MKLIMELFRVYQQLLILLVLADGYHNKFYMDSDSDQDYYRYHPSAIPNFLPVPTNITVHQGELAKLRCRIYNLGPKLVVWRRTNEEFPLTVGEATFSPEERFSVFHDRISEMETHWDLLIDDVQPEHAGIYECSISATDIYTLNVTLNILDPVKYEPELSINGTEYVSVKKKIQLTCNLTGSERAPQKADWFFAGEVINQSHPRWYGRLQELNRIPVPGRSLISTIIIEKATMSDAGNYVCRQTPKLAKGLKVHILNDFKEPNSKRRVVEKNKGGALYQEAASSSVCLNSLDRTTVAWTIFILTYLLRNAR